MMKKTLLAIAVLALLMLLPATSALAEEPTVDWWAEYYKNPSLNGDPAVTRSEEAIQNDWGYGAPLPGFPSDSFSVRWTTTTEFEASNYTFTATVDDGVRVWIDGELIIDQWNVQSVRTFTAKKWLSAGTHTVQVAYFENAGEAVAIFWWRQDGGTEPPCQGPHCNKPCMGPNCPPQPCLGFDCDKYPPQCPQDAPCRPQPCQGSDCGSMPMPPQRPPTKPMPPQKPPMMPSEPIVIDNLDQGFTWGGSTKYRGTAYGGVNGSFYYTQNTVTEPVNYGKWTPWFTSGGYYEVFVFIPSTNATTQNLRYRVMHDAERNDVIINQYMYSDQWVSLGTYYFRGNNMGREFVLVYDNTREPYASAMIAFDAVKFMPRQ